jgi:hypothetical protein
MLSAKQAWRLRLARIPAPFFLMFYRFENCYAIQSRLRVTVICIFALCLGWPHASEAYSVLTHEAIVDAAWETNIRPLLLVRFPGATPDDLRKAHAFAYERHQSRHGLRTEALLEECCLGVIRRRLPLLERCTHA